MKTHRALVVRGLVALSIVAGAAMPAEAMSFRTYLHLHPHTPAVADNRAILKVRNGGEFFQEVVVLGETYTVRSRETITIKAPVGTVVYAGGCVPRHRRGDVLAVVGVDPTLRVL